ncbi:MAG TPA: PHP domain-containing protein [Candidatus Saccharimonadales bacterium]
MAYKVDFHTHSVMSPDGSLRSQDYRAMLERGRLDCIAVTDHNVIDAALELHKELGDRVIVGEEIMTTEGEIIGLYLTKLIPAGQPPDAVVAQIHEQGGLVYVPHPFETVRHGLSAYSLDAIAADVDIIEAYNGRAVFQNCTKEAVAWATAYTTPMAAGSDAHGRIGWGKTYTVLPDMPSRSTLTTLLADATHHHKWPGIIGIAYPKFNRLRKKTRREGKR